MNVSHSVTCSADKEDDNICSKAIRSQRGPGRGGVQGSRGSLVGLLLSSRASVLKQDLCFRHQTLGRKRHSSYFGTGQPRHMYKQGRLKIL